MTDSIFNKTELWESIRKVSEQKRKIHALRFVENYHTIASLNDEKMVYTITFKSNKQHEINFNELYLFYTELYRNGWIDCNFMAQNCKKLVNKSFIMNGSAMLADIYHFDRNVLNDGGVLSLKKKNE